ncbi:DNA-processing protein DprA [Kineosporia sp. R_H_3]|uniref:DNA-processing protein DprA n=1 Tax=Kineosporia sp. R_H_3 TaxID=1961848 RepID=UPI0018EA2240|nr:DNA-processing protein DprA [Kineosporia sp. R_H_3]
MTGGAGAGGARLRLVRPEWLDPEDERTARAVWSRIAEPGDRDAAVFVREHGPGPALARVLGGARVPRTTGARGRGGPERPGAGAPAGGDAADGWRERLAVTDPRRDLATLHRFGGRLLVPGDAEWPAGLDDLGDRRPFCLWVRGALDLGQVCRRAVAMVGSRASTAYGETVAAQIAAGLAERGVTVVSGAAFGIDAAAHRSALAFGGATVAVLACGVDRPYPRSHERLIDRIVAEGVLVSEVPPASSPTRWRFLERNRLIAAMSGATVVVEAALRSGALVTAREAEDLSRQVAAVPGPVTSVASSGCHLLLRDRAAGCVTSAADVHALVARIGEAEPDPPSGPRAAHDDLGPLDLRVFEAVPVRSAAPTASVARTAGLGLPEVEPALGRLDLLGLVRREGAGWRRSPAPRRRPGAPAG